MREEIAKQCRHRDPPFFIGWNREVLIFFSLTQRVFLQSNMATNMPDEVAGIFMDSDSEEEFEFMQP